MISKTGQRDSDIYTISLPEDTRIYLVFIGKVKQASDLYHLVQIIRYCCCFYTSIRQHHRWNLRYLAALYQKNPPLLDSKAQKYEAERFRLLFICLNAIISDVLANFI